MGKKKISVQLSDQVLMRWIRKYCKAFPDKANAMPRSRKDFLPYFDDPDGFYDFIGWLTGKDLIEMSLTVNRYIEERGMEQMRILALMAMQAAYVKEGRAATENLDIVDALLYRDEPGLPDGFNWDVAQS